MNEFNEPIGDPFVIQNTAGPNWLLTWSSAIAVQPVGEVVSFTVSVPKNAALTIVQVQSYAIKRAMELLQTLDKHYPHQE